MKIPFYPQFRALILCTALMTAPVCFSADIRTEHVQFAKGAHSAVVTSSIRGYEVVDYVLRAQAGQYMNVSLATKQGATYFNILAPGENEEAMFIGSTSGNQFEGTLPKTGDYKIRIYMMRSAARRNTVAQYRLEMIIGTNRSATYHNHADTKVAGTNYHAMGKIPCSQYQGQPMNTCTYGVNRHGNGNATVTITKMDGQQRVIFFTNGRATGYDKSQADNAKFSTQRNADLNLIYIGNERYEIPDAVVSGG